MSFNFNQEGYYHKTYGGGLMTILVKSLMGLYIYSLFRKMIDFDEDRIYSQAKIDDDEDSIVKWEET